MNYIAFYVYNKLILLVILILLFGTITRSGPNNLHIQDGTSSAEIIGNDVFFEIIEPTELRYTYRIRPAKNFGGSFNTSLSIKEVRLMPMKPKLGCNPPHISIQDSVVLILRGECSFKKKAIIAEKAGATAVIITDISKKIEDYFVEMIDDNTNDEVKIPVGFLMGKNGIMITRTLEKLNRSHAIINLPINLTFTPIYEMNQPPWLTW